MKNTKILILATAVASWLSPLHAQTTEVTVNLLSKLAKSDGDGDRSFNISFGSLNGGLAPLLSKEGADGAAGFATWYGNNSRTLLEWNGVNGASIVDSDSFYRYYGADTSIETRAGGPLTSIFSSSLDNRALAFVSYSNGGVVEEIGLYDFGFNWGDLADTGSFPVGVYDIFTLASSGVWAYSCVNITSTNKNTRI